MSGLEANGDLGEFVDLRWLWTPSPSPSPGPFPPPSPDPAPPRQRQLVQSTSRKQRLERKRRRRFSESLSEFARNRPRAANGRFLTTSTKDCAICAETKLVIEFPDSRISQTCAHSSNTCLTCVRRSIKVDFETRQWNHIHCPECRESLDYHSVKKYADEETFNRYGSLLFLLVFEIENLTDCLQVRGHVSSCSGWRDT